MLASTESAADFPPGCAPQQCIRPSSRPTPPLDSRIALRGPPQPYSASLGSCGIVNTWFREGFFSPTLGNEHLTSGLRPYPVAAHRNNPTSKKYDIMGESMPQAGKAVVLCSRE